MSVTTATPTRNAIAALVGGAIDAGTTNATGQSIIRTSGLVAVATNTYANPAFGAPSVGVITANAIGDDINAAGGVAAIVTNEDRDNVEVWRGTVTNVGGGGDMEITDVNVNAGDTLQQTSVTYTAPP